MKIMPQEARPRGLGRNTTFFPTMEKLESLQEKIIRLKTENYVLELYLKRLGVKETRLIKIKGKQENDKMSYKRKGSILDIVEEDFKKLYFKMIEKSNKVRKEAEDIIDECYIHLDLLFFIYSHWESFTFKLGSGFKFVKCLRSMTKQNNQRLRDTIMHVKLITEKNNSLEKYIKWTEKVSKMLTYGDVLFLKEIKMELEKESNKIEKDTRELKFLCSYLSEEVFVMRNEVDNRSDLLGEVKEEIEKEAKEIKYYKVELKDKTKYLAETHYVFNKHLQTKKYEKLIHIPKITDYFPMRFEFIKLKEKLKKLKRDLRVLDDIMSALNLKL